MGRVVAIHIARTKGAPLELLESARLFAARGIEGDHRCLELTPETPRDGRDVTLIETEALDALKRDYDLELDGPSTRRNILTEGIALNHLVGREFRIGEVRLLGVRLCEPCAHLESLTKEGVRAALVHRGGLRATILDGGVVRKGDAIRTG
ncbi:MAG: MOSC domain-containing protein [bacterium]